MACPPTTVSDVTISSGTFHRRAAHFFDLWEASPSGFLPATSMNPN